MAVVPPKNRPHASDGPGAAAGGALDLLEESAHPDRCPGCGHALVVSTFDPGGPLVCEHCACVRWPPRLRLASSGGDLVAGRCASTRLCPYCARLAAVESAEMLALDAMDAGGPTLWLVLTTSDPYVRPSEWREARRLVTRALRRRWPTLEYVQITEFTTGYGPRSGGRRRPHLNVMLKGVGEADLRRVRAVASRVWRQHLPGSYRAQYAGTVTDSGGLMRYLALHFLKESQAPPRGWKGHRVTASRGYYARPVWQVRRDAREHIRSKRALTRALAAGYAPGEAEHVAALDVHRAKQLRWQLVIVEDRVNVRTGELAPRAWALDGSEPNVALHSRATDLAAAAVHHAERLDYEASIESWRRAAGADTTRAEPPVAPYEVTDLGVS